MKHNLSAADKEFISRLATQVDKLRSEIGKRIVGLDLIVDHLLMSLMSGGHSLLVGVPGLAKTLLISTISQTLSLDFNRIQFTPDLMPSDITGTDIIKVSGNKREFSFRQGPIFSNVILADEINRTPPKTQAALIEAMEEQQVTVGNNTYKLEAPFFVLATQNPIEQEGTYPLPVAQLDRFMFSLSVGYPSLDEEYQILRRTTSGYSAEIKNILTRDEVIQSMQVVRNIGASDEMLRYAMRISRLTRGVTDQSPAFIREWLNWGGGPRATQAMILGAKARALLSGRLEIAPEDLRAVAPAVLRHRAIISYNAEADGLTIDEIIEELLLTIPAPDGYGNKNRHEGFLAILGF